MQMDSKLATNQVVIYPLEIQSLNVRIKSSRRRKKRCSFIHFHSLSFVCLFDVHLVIHVILVKELV